MQISARRLSVQSGAPRLALESGSESGWVGPLASQFMTISLRQATAAALFSRPGFRS